MNGNDTQQGGGRPAAPKPPASSAVDARHAIPEGPTAPLAGIRVLDLTRLLPGPVCTLHLADLGAEVIKVEDTGAGDYARTLGAKPGDISAFFRMVNRNKRSVALDLKRAGARQAFLALARHADVIVESFRPGVVAALGVDYAAVRPLRPSIVYASISGYGQTGPRANAPGHDINYLGYAGVLDQTGTRGGPPALANLQIADLLGGALSAAVAILAAVVGAQRTGEGRYVDVAMADGALAHNIFALHALEQWGHALPRGEDLLTGGVPCYGVYPTQDGRWLAVGALEEKFWRTLCATLERPDLVPLQHAVGADGARTRAALEAQFRTAPLAHWAARFEGLDACVTPVATLDGALDDPQFLARGMVVTDAEGRRAYAPPWQVSGHRFRVSRPPPAQGEHTREVLREAGYDDRDVATLIEDGSAAEPR
ncbi:MAG TPA: CaiB/BaiF CoA-transferase family protein [Casimicrobiaceae bacterium]|nr:CaiB/BaiF CoA-transferase family protein [Casimicrobiaceae bacterium]